MGDFFGILKKAEFGLFSFQVAKVERLRDGNKRELILVKEAGGQMSKELVRYLWLRRPLKAVSE